jgi:DNA (cytosine-5)-methyltransferase 1
VRYLSVCSGIEAATVAWHPLGWAPAAFSEIEAFPRAVLAHHYPDVPCHGDFTTIGADEYGPIDLLVGGTPCQSFSVAGLRGGLGDDRGNLALEYLRLADRTRPRWLVWENVPGVLSSNGGRDFGAILGGMVELGYSFSYRVLDAQFFGVPQRRRRVFVVGHLGDWRRAAAVLFERYSLQGNPAPRRETGQAIAGSLTSRASGGGGGPGAGTDEAAAGYLQAVAYQTSGNCGAWETGAVTGALDTNTDPNSNVICFGSKENAQDAGEVSPPLRAMGSRKDHPNGGGQIAVCFAQNSRDDLRGMPYVDSLAAEPGMKQQSYVRQASAVRRLTPRECERLQGFPDDYTAVPYRGKPAADGPRYKALGNSMAVPVMRWIGERIAMVEAIADRHSKSGDVQQAPSRSDESGGAGTAIAKKAA